MRFKAITLFLAIQILSFFIWKSMSPDVQVMAEEPAPIIHAVSGTLVNETKEKNQIEFSVRHFNDLQSNLNIVLQEHINKTFEKLPSSHVETVKKIILDYDMSAHRGLGGNNLIILNAVKMDEKEFIAVLIHETAHNVDYGYLAPDGKKIISNFKDGAQDLYITDPSIDFYQISWENETILKKTASNLDFVSGYAMTNPFEDFAETYTYYILHNASFKSLTASSEDLYAKYQFMKYRVFDGVEFDTGNSETEIYSRSWDTTLLSYDLEGFINL